MQNPFAPLRVVRTNKMCPDPAIDLANSDIKTYRKTRDLKHITFLPGCQPDIFVVSHLPARYYRSIRTSGTQILTETVAFMVACHRIERADGTVLEPSNLIPVTVPGVNEKTAPDDWFELVAGVIARSCG